MRLNIQINLSLIWDRLYHPPPLTNISVPPLPNNINHLSKFLSELSFDIDGSFVPSKGKGNEIRKLETSRYCFYNQIKHIEISKK
jgi:hypothetical protein